MSKFNYARFLNFLTEELSISSDSISMAERSVNQDSALLPIVMLKYGFISIKQLDQIYEWLDSCG